MSDPEIDSTFIQLLKENPLLNEDGKWNKAYVICNYLKNNYHTVITVDELYHLHIYGQPRKLTISNYFRKVCNKLGSICRRLI